MRNNLERLSRLELRQLLLQNDNSFLPQVCNSYNKGTGPYGHCPDQEECRRLHLCDRYITGTCRSGGDCNRCHDFFEPHPRRVLQKRGVANDLIPSMLSTYQNILAMKGKGASGAATGSQPKSCPHSAGRTEICPFFVKEDCKQGEKCWRVHSKMPYVWEVKEGSTWSPLPENEAIEKDFCDPCKMFSEGSSHVCFDSMTCGSGEVRRLCTISSVLKPKYCLTTNWEWFWKDECGHWVKYPSIKEMQRLSSITSEDLENKYQEDQSAVLKFTAGQQSYELSFRDMTQRNERYGTISMVRRRPVFVSASEVQAIRSRKIRPRNTVQNFMAVPEFWDKSAIPDIGYKRVSLLGSDRDYQKVLGLFKKTMRVFNIISIERVQNRDLWEVFQWKRDRMKKNNGDKYSKELTLFHGTDPKHVDAICRDNFDWRLCGTNGTVYGQGSYFARDAKYSHKFTGNSGERSMFCCRVLVGDYTKGNSELRRPPSKGEGNPSLYDSCVNNVQKPSKYVVFERHQVYPEFLIKYNDGAAPKLSLASAPPRMLSVPSISLTPRSGLTQTVAATTKSKTVSIQSTSLTSRSNKTQVIASTTPLQIIPSTFSPSQTAANLTFYKTNSYPTLSSVNQIRPIPARTPSPIPMDYTTSFTYPSHTVSSTASAFKTVSTRASTSSNTVSTPASTSSNTVSTPASTSSNTVSTPVSTQSNTVSTPVSAQSNTVSTPVRAQSNTVSTPVSAQSNTVSTPVSAQSNTVSTPASKRLAAYNEDYTASFAYLSRTVTTQSNTVSTPVRAQSNTVSTPVCAQSNTVCTPVRAQSNTVCTPVRAQSNTVCTPVHAQSNTVSTPVRAQSNTVSTPVSAPVSAQSNTVSTPVSAQSNTVSTPVSAQSNTVSTPVSAPVSAQSNTVSTPVSAQSNTVSTPVSAQSNTVSTPASKRLAAYNEDYTASFAYLSRTVTTQSNTVSTPVRAQSNTVSTPVRAQSNTVSTPVRAQSNTVCTPVRAQSNTVCTPVRAQSNTVCTPVHAQSNTVSTPVRAQSNTVCTPVHAQSNTVSTPVRAQSNTVSTPVSAQSNTVSTRATKILAPKPPTLSPVINPSAGTPSCTLSPSTSHVSRAYTLSATTPPTHSVTTLYTSFSMSSDSSTRSSPSVRRLSPVYSPSTGAFSRPLSAPTRNISEGPSRAPTASKHRTDTNGKNKCLLQ
ncbi:mucin-17-like isoform X2 [Esox lucius]|nr:mucin-17-like isoform X2 [Esox lucius]